MVRFIQPLVPALVGRQALGVAVFILGEALEDRADLLPHLREQIGHHPECICHCKALLVDEDRPAINMRGADVDGDLQAEGVGLLLHLTERGFPRDVPIPSDGEGFGALLKEGLEGGCGYAGCCHGLLLYGTGWVVCTKVQREKQAEI